MNLVRRLLILSLFLLVPLSSTASTINFDDLQETFDDPLPSPYAGFSWDNFRYFSFDDNAGFPTWQAAISSKPNAAYSGGTLGPDQIVGTFSRTTAFDFTSAYLGVVNYATMNLTVQGWLGGVLKYSQVVSLDSNGADLFVFNFLNVDAVTLTGSINANDPCDFNCSQFTVDDIVYGRATQTVPEPATVSLLGLGAAALWRARRSRRS